MPLGQPSITTPSTLQLQALQSTIANIRERFRAAEAVVLALQQGQAAPQSASDLSALARTIAALTGRVTALEQAGAGGEVGGDDSQTYQAGEALVNGSPVWLSDVGIVSAIDPDDPLAAAGFTGIATQGADVGGVVQVCRRGVAEIPGAAFTVGRPLYAAVGGVTHEPVGNALPVGVAVSATAMSVAGGTLALAVAGIDVLGEDFLPVTYALAAEAIELAMSFDLDATPGPADGDVLTYDAATMLYRPEPSASGAGGVLPVVTGEAPPVLVYLDDGSLVYSGVA